MSAPAKVVSEADRQDLITHVDYRPETGEFFRKTKGPGCIGGIGARMCTKPARDGYYNLCVKQKRYLAHRAAWIIVNGLIPEGMQIDHIDHDRGNNRLNNLRLVTVLGNKKNESRRKDNKSGVTGVCWNDRAKKWQAYYYRNRKLISLGYYENKEHAAAARAAANENAGFHQNHGKPAQQRVANCSI